MNVQQVIDRLMTVEDKTLPVVFTGFDEDGAELTDEIAYVEPSDGVVLYSDTDSVYKDAHVVVLSP